MYTYIQLYMHKGIFVYMHAYARKHACTHTFTYFRDQEFSPVPPMSIYPTRFLTAAIPYLLFPSSTMTTLDTSNINTFTHLLNKTFKIVSEIASEAL